MLPENNLEDVVVDEIKEKAFLIDFDKKKLGGLIDGKKALLQAIRVALLTQRYKYALFSHSYGTDYAYAFEDGYSKALARLKNAICDSLIHDDRIEAIDSFVFEKRGTKIIVRFRVLSVYGQLDFKTEVEN